MILALLLGLLGALIAGPGHFAQTLDSPTLTIEVEDQARHGEPHRLTVSLTDRAGRPLAGETIVVFEEIRLFDYTDTALVAEMRTDSHGRAAFTHVPAAPGPGRLTAEYRGSERFGPATAAVSFTVAEGVGIATPVLTPPPPSVLPRGVTAAWFLPLLIGVWLALAAAVYNMVHIPRAGSAPGE